MTPFRILCAVGLFAIFSSTMSKSPVLPLFASHLGADPAWVGAVSAVSAFTGIIASIPAGILSDRFGRKRILVLAAVIFATAPFLYLFVDQLWQLAAVRFYHGFGTSLFVPVAMALVSDLFTTGRGEKIGWFSSATLLGRFVAPAAGGAILGFLHAAPDMGFTTVYLVCGLAGIVTFALVVATPTRERCALPHESWQQTLAVFKTALSTRGILITAAVEAAILFSYGTFETFMPLSALASGLNAYQIGMLLSVQVVTLALTKPVMGRFSDRHGRQPQIFGGALAGSVCIACIGLATDFVTLLVLSILFGLCLSIVTSASSALIADLSRRENLGSSMGILGSVMDIGHTTGPLVSGIIAASFGFSASFIGAGAVLVAVGLLFWIMIPKHTITQNAVKGDSL